MFKPGTTSGALLFHVIRLSPLATPLMLGALSTLTDIENSQEALGRLLVLSVIVIVWGMAESSIMLWHRAKQRQAESSRGYGFVTLLLGIVLLGLLNIFRARSSQSLFLLTLAMISVRGMSRAGWEQGRPRVAFTAAIAGAILLTLLAFFAVSPDFYWEKIAFATAIGCAAASVEATWFGDALRASTETRWALPLYRLVLLAGPVIVATMALAGYLPRCYTAVYILVPFAARVITRASGSGINLTSCYRATAGVYAGFMGIITACLLYMAPR
jgi:hypothetical protein